MFDAPDVEDSDVHTFLSPRLGFAYPVTENTVFHAQYGKFYQMPRLIDLYVSKNYLNIMLLDHPYYDNTGFPNLEPEKTTSYEIGFKQRLSSLAAINITAFYKETANLVREENWSTDIQDIGFMQNTDFGTVKGLEFNFTLRRFHNFSAGVNYTLSYAVGTGSNSNTLRDITWL
ncbi:MAG: TonB-dependent receptor, partial [Aliifodinibius sp.]|nr:TonB-dependent receptor [Fodinibius sp.]NIY28231.1 TonB-dependent receptor [Fodinibius sp.]